MRHDTRSRPSNRRVGVRVRTPGNDFWSREDRSPHSRAAHQLGNRCEGAVGRATLVVG